MEHHTLESAIRLAAKVHKGQIDRFGKPYVLHVMRVMMRGHDLEEQVLGALHDVLERSTRRVDEDYEGYIDRVLRDGLAMRVKLHDLADKMDLLHVDELSVADLKRYNKQLAAYHKLKRAVEIARANMDLPVRRAKAGT